MAIEVHTAHIYIRADSISVDRGDLKIIDPSGSRIYVTIPEHVLADLLKAAKELAE